MTGGPTDFELETAIRLAVRAPSVHNAQPWRWRTGDRTLHLYADPDRHLPCTDPDGRDLLLSCGAGLHHARVALAALGWQNKVHRLPNPADPDHLAAMELTRHDSLNTDIVLAATIPRRRTDRRRYSRWPVPPTDVELIARRAAAEGAALDLVTDRAREHTVEAIKEAARRHRADPAYHAELAAWSGRRFADDGVPSANTPMPEDAVLPARSFADPELRQPEGVDQESAETVLLVLSTPSDDALARLRAGEAASAALLTATALGLACCPLTEPLEITETRAALRRTMTSENYPQMIIRVGWAPINADPLPATPRRPLTEVAGSLEARQ